VIECAALANCVRVLSASLGATIRVTETLSSALPLVSAYATIAFTVSMYGFTVSGATHSPKVITGSVIVLPFVVPCMMDDIKL
jgi:hypothetical protein